ncbi:MAG: hypothetical protein Q8921_01175 [Bacteroidota bacterium]|nr:hypothetical protein [Bacteroidota bacterium]
MSFVIVLAGCDLFSTRTPEPPSSSNTFIWTPATTVEILMGNFTGALQAFDASNYTKVFIAATDSTGSGPKAFAFTPIAGLDPASRTIFTNWTVEGPSESEHAWLAKLAALPHSGPLAITLGAIAPVQSSNAASLTTSYTIALPTGVIPTDTVRGSLEMQFLLVTTEQGTKEWRIVSWTDFAPTGGTSETWTDLKLKLSS